MPNGVDVIRGDERLRGSFSPLRRKLLEELREPASASAVATRLGESRQRVNYHLRELEKSGLVELVELRPRRGCTERVLRATARAVVVEPGVAGDLVSATQDRFAVDTLLATSTRTIGEVAAMRERADAAGKRLVTFAIDTEVGFAKPTDIERFANELAEHVVELAAKYSTPAAERRYRITIGGHPVGRTEEPTT